MTDIERVLAAEEQRVVVLRFAAREADEPVCALMDETLARAAEYVRQFAVVYAVDLARAQATTQQQRQQRMRSKRGGRDGDVGESIVERFALNAREPCSVMFFHRGRHIKVDCGTGNTEKITFAVSRVQDMIDIVEVVFRQARRGKGLAVAPRNFNVR